MLAAVLAAAPAAAQVRAVRLNPLTEWQVGRDSDTCTITRQFGDSERPTTLFLRNRDPWDGGFDVGVSSQKYALTGSAFRAGWLPNGRFVTRTNAASGNAQDGGAQLLFHHGLWDAKSPEQGAPEYAAYWQRDAQDEPIGPITFKRSVQTFLVDGAFERPLLFATGPMDAVVVARDDCIAEMLAALGVDPADEKRSDRRAEMTNQTELSRYIITRAPRALFADGKATYISFLVYLDGGARVTSCRYLELPQDAAFEQFGCDVLRERGNFKFRKGEAAQPTFFKMTIHAVPPGWVRQ